MECAFQAGMRVVCVDAEEHDNELSEHYVFVGSLDGLVKGTIYTVRSLYVDPLDGQMCLRLNEIERGYDPSIGAEPGYIHFRFRHIVERKTSIEVFKKLLIPSRVGETA